MNLHPVPGQGHRSNILCEKYKRDDSARYTGHPLSQRAASQSMNESACLSPIQLHSDPLGYHPNGHGESLNHSSGPKSQISLSPSPHSGPSRSQFLSILVLDHLLPTVLGTSHYICKYTELQRVQKGDKSEELTLRIISLIHRPDGLYQTAQ